MPDPFLQHLTVKNFRSIRGEISVPLDAPVVLIHGRNGVGKTSLLSAIELALTGDVTSLRRIEPNVHEYLLHRGTDTGSVSLKASAGKGSGEFIVEGKGLLGSALLERPDAHFFNERCYLAQSTLSRLLEIYQHQERRGSDSPLTKFVKELLRLDQYDALIDGLHISGDVRRLRDYAPLYLEVRDRIEALKKKAKDNETQQQELRQLLSVPVQRLQSQTSVQGLSESVSLTDIPQLRAQFQPEKWNERIAFLSRLLHQVSVAVNSVQALENSASSAGAVGVERDAIIAAEEYNRWEVQSGSALESAIKELGVFVSVSTTVANADPVTKQRLAHELASGELDRLDAALSKDGVTRKRIGELAASIQNGNARIATLEEQILGISDSSGNLAQALSGLLPHIDSDHCPVCARDYGEVSKVGLATHVANRVAALVEAAGRLQALAKDRADTLNAVTTAQRLLANEEAQAMQPPQLEELKLRRAGLADIKVKLSGLAQASIAGAALYARRNLALRNRQTVDISARSIAVTRNSVIECNRALNLPILPEGFDVPVEAEKIRVAVESELGRLSKEQAQTSQTLNDIGEIERVLQRVQAVEKRSLEIFEQNLEFSLAKQEADKVIDAARSISKVAKELKNGIVRRVFNNDLNAVWRALFVRLAPDEDFVPAFALPAANAADVEAALETHYRAGGKGGNPRAMLSAGNLNTAALTLFLSLHLSVRPSVPCLIIDDPVQSMDEVHISQFAALLRTLSKEKGRQVVIAVHERSLFDYLALELSPSYPGDRLITIQLERSLDENSIAQLDIRVFEPDTAVAA